ncbi:MAG: DUF4405 domain-containing protein [Chloroflexota bacterium]
MEKRRSIRFKVYARAVVAIMLIVVWLLAAFTGLLLWLTPTGPGSGQRVLLLGLTKQEWGDIHFWISVAVLIVTLIHIVIDWKALRGVIRYLTSVHRDTRKSQITD